MTIRFSQLVVSAMNVRHGSEDDPGIDTLEASIRKRGLLQPILVVARDDGTYEVAAGRRRLTALKRVFGEDGEVHPDWLREITAEAAIGASLHENYVRQDMDTRELYGAFKRLADEAGLTPEEIADELGYGVDRVRRILRLSRLHPDLITAWNEGHLDMGEAQAFAVTEDAELQLKVAKKVAKEYAFGSKDDLRLRGYGHIIKREMKKALKADDFDANKLRYVGIEAYKAAGGALVEDLFSTDPIVLDGKLVETLADAKLEEEKVEALAKMQRADKSELNVEWVDDEQLPQVNLYGYMQRDDACRIEPEIRGKGKHQNAIIPAGGKVLAVASLRNGESQYALYWASRADGGIAEPKNKSTKTEAPAKAELPEGVRRKQESGATSRTAFMAMQVLFADAVGDSFLKEAVELPGLPEETHGLETLLFALTWQQQRMIGITGFPRCHEPERGPHQVKELLGNTGRLTVSDYFPEATWLDAPTLAEAWDGYRGWISTNRTAQLGAVLLKLLWSPIANNFREEPRPLLVLLAAESTGMITCDQDKAIDLLSHKARVEAMRSWGVPEDHLKPLRKATSADYMRSLIAEPDKCKLLGFDHNKATSWLPSEMKVEAVERPKPKVEKPKAKPAKPEPVRDAVDA